MAKHRISIGRAPMKKTKKGDTAKFKRVLVGKRSLVRR